MLLVGLCASTFRRSCVAIYPVSCLGTYALRVVFSLLILPIASSAFAEFVTQPPPGMATPQMNVIEKLGQTVPLDLSLVDDTGKAVKLRDYFSGRRPVILQLGYYGCPMLCTLVSEGMADSLRQLALKPGEEVEVLYVSIDPRETADLAAGKKASIVKVWNKPGAEKAIHLLTGLEQNTAALADAVGFQYQWVETARQYAHPAVLIVLSPEGKITRYLYGVKYDPTTLRLSLVESAEGKVGSSTDRFILTCFQYDGKQGKYAVMAVRLMQAGAIVTVAALSTVIFLFFRWERRRQKAIAQAS